VSRALIDGRVARIVDHFFDPELREAFVRDYITPQTACEILSPDPFLRDDMDRYALIAQVYQMVYNYFDPEPEKRRLQRDLLRKTDRLIREKVKVAYLAEPLPLYPINRDLVKVIAADNVSDRVKVINLSQSGDPHRAVRGRTALPDLHRRRSGGRYRLVIQVMR
jgi:hypothetical protein